MGMTGARTADALAGAAYKFADTARLGHQDNLKRAEEKRRAGLSKAEWLLRLTDMPGYSVAGDDSLEPPAVGSALGAALIGANRPAAPAQRTATDYRPGEPRALGAALTGLEFPQNGGAMFDAATRPPLKPIAPREPAESAPPRRPLQRIPMDFGHGEKVDVEFDPSKTTAALGARAKAEEASRTAKSNREAFELLKQVDPDSYDDSVFVGDVDWQEELKRVLPNRGRQASLRAAGWSEADAHTQGFHTTNLREERRSEATSGRAGEDQTFQREDRVIEGARGMARTMAENGGSSQTIFNALSKMPQYKSIKPDRLLRAISESVDDAAIAKNRPEGPRAQPQDPRTTERRRGIVDMLGRTPTDEFEQQVVDDLVAGKTPDQILSQMREVQLDSAQIGRAEKFLGRYRTQQLIR